MHGDGSESRLGSRGRRAPARSPVRRAVRMLTLASGWACWLPIASVAAERVQGPGSGPVSDLLTAHLSTDDPLRPTLLREGAFVVQRRGRVISREGGGWLFQFLTPDGTPASASASTPKLPDMVLQPSQRLEAMLAAVNAETEPILFMLTGQVHVYDGQNHLLPTELSGFTEVEQSVTRPGVTPGDGPARPTTEPPARQVEVDPAQMRGPLSVQDLLEVSPPVEGPEGGTAPRDGGPTAEGQTPEALMAALAAERDPDRVGGAPVLSLAAGPVPEPVGTRAASAAGADGKVLRRREGDLLIERAVRVAAPETPGPQTGTRPPTQLRFLADSAASPEPPVEVLPSRLRTRLERQSRQLGADTVFLVSGRIYRFQDRDYFLPTAARVRPSAGRLDGSP